MRVHIMNNRMTLHQADMLEYYLRSKPYVRDVRVYDRTGDAVIIFTDRARVIRALAAFSYKDKRTAALVPEHTGRELSREFENRLFNMLARRMVFKRLVPAPLRLLLSVAKASKYVREGFRSLSKGRIEVSLLDAVAITVSLLRGEYKTASSVMFMLGLGELLEDWTHKKSVDDLARNMSLGVEKVWLRSGGTLLTYLLTRNATKAVSILMVDFSCALKLAMPISVISAMREGQTRGMTIKGGKFLEAVAEADTIIFDKTGTLTYSELNVAGVITFGENDEAEALLHNSSTLAISLASMRNYLGQ